MRYPKTLLIATSSVLLIGAGAVTLAASRDHMVPIATTVSSMLENVPRAIHDAILGKDIGGGTQASTATNPETLPANATQATATVRTFMNSTDLTLTYSGNSANPYNENGPRIDYYADSQGNEYWIDRVSNRLVQMGPAASASPTPQQARSEARKDVATLREKAMAIAGAQMPNFAEIRSTLHPLEDNKEKEVYFFRWDDSSSPIAEFDMPPFLQVGLNADGSVASFTNTLQR